LESVLKALEAAPQERTQIYARLTEPRSVRLAPRVVPTSLLGSLPGIGDLLRAMRVRRGWTQEQFAEEMRVSRATVIRWEATRTLPSEEDMERLCGTLHAAPEEQAALRARRLSPSSWRPQLTLEECIEQVEILRQVRSGEGSLMPIVDLYTLALKRQLRFLLGQSSEALRRLAQMEVQHGWWLYMHGRAAEACAGNWRALNLVRGAHAPETFWVNALNLLAAHAANGARGPEKAVRLLSPWLPQFPASLHPYLLCDLALYAGRAQRHEEAMNFLQRAQKAMSGRSKESAEAQGSAHWYVRMTTARVLLSGGKPVEALDWFPEENVAGDGRIHELLVWAEAYLAAGEKNQASRYLSEAQTLLATMPLPQRQSKLEQLAQQL
jgi:transcriptional regulator with XRE-family HTH domain